MYLPIGPLWALRGPSSKTRFSGLALFMLLIGQCDALTLVGASSPFNLTNARPYWLRGKEGPTRARTRSTGVSRLIQWKGYHREDKMEDMLSHAVTLLRRVDGHLGPNLGPWAQFRALFALGPSFHRAFCVIMPLGIRNIPAYQLRSTRPGALTTV